jgi:hypothetical protein
MKQIIILSILLIIGLGITCTRDNRMFIDCDECYYIRPDSADLMVKITINEENPFVPLVFYKGKIEDGIVEWIDTATTSELYLYSPVESYYSIKAIYKNEGRTVIAVDGDRLNTRQVSGVCDRDCWVIDGGILDVRLK